MILPGDESSAVKDVMSVDLQKVIHAEYTYPPQAPSTYGSLDLGPPSKIPLWSVMIALRALQFLCLWGMWYVVLGAMV